jgi:dihydroorotate dehydrogenase (NAD+) catalytic subunit
VSRPLASYDIRQSYDWNYAHAPVASPADAVASAVPGHWRYAGLRVPSPLGIAAGPLLNGRWVLHYAALGFDALTYKTVRSRARACYPLPNLQPVACQSFDGSAGSLAAADAMQGSWAVSFGMPSRAPDVWRADVAATRRALPPEKILSVSVVATPEPAWSIDDVADDYARCAKWAVESGADCVEANLSCPNVASCDGQLYQQPQLAGLVTARIRQAIGHVPLLIKLGHVTHEALAAQLVQACASHCQALVMVNCISATVTDADQRPMFSGDRRGIAGRAIRPACLDQVKLFARVVAQQGSSLGLIGVGGIASSGDVTEFLRAGCQSVQLATAAMLNPEIGWEIRKELAGLATAGV